MLFYTTYIHYNHKLLVSVKKLAIAKNKFKRLVSKGSPKLFQKKEEGKNEVFVYICFEIKQRVLILTINQEFVYNSKLGFLLAINIDISMT